MMGALIRRDKWDTYTKATFDAFERKDGVVAHTRNSYTVRMKIGKLVIIT